MSATPSLERLDEIEAIAESMRAHTPIASMLHDALCDALADRDVWKQEAVDQHEYALDIINSTKSRKRTAALMADLAAARKDADELRERVTSTLAIYDDHPETEQFIGKEAKRVIVAVRTALAGGDSDGD